MSFKKSDIIAILIIGEIVAWFFFAVLKNLALDLKIQEISGLEPQTLLVILAVFVPVAALICLYIVFLLGKKIPVIFQMGKFVSVGLSNTAIDFGVLNFLMFLFGITTGRGYSIFKGISFIAAVINSYLWNKFWTFKKREIKGMEREFLQFLIVASIGFGINVAIASFINNIIGPQFGVPPKFWANISAIFAILAGMIWDFLGYKFIVFKR